MRSLMAGQRLEDAPKEIRRRVQWKYFVLVVLALGLFWVVSVIGESKVVWRSDYAAALIEAKKSKRPILLDFWASWCPPCRLMDGRIFSSDAVATAVHRGFIPVRIDLTNNDPNSPQAEIARKFDVTVMPTLLVIDWETESIQARPTDDDEAAEAAFIAFLEKIAKQ